MLRIQTRIATVLDAAGRALYALGVRTGGNRGGRVALAVARNTVGFAHDVLAPNVPCTCGQTDCPDRV